jgi:hypothetical protein
MENVDFDAEQAPRRAVLMESASGCSLFFVTVVFACFVGGHFASALRLPSFVHESNELFPLDHSRLNSSVEVEITLSLLREHHRSVAMRGFLLRGFASGNWTLPVDVAVRMAFLRGRVVWNLTTVPSRRLAIDFRQGDARSGGFDVVDAKVKGYDSVALRVTISARLESLMALSFRWTFWDQTAVNYLRVALFFMSGLNVYMLVLFLVFVRFDSEIFTQVFCIFIGCVAAVASNPFALIQWQGSDPGIADCMLMSFAVAMFRLFCFAQVDIVRSHETNPNLVVLILLVIVLCAYAAIDAAAFFARWQTLCGRKALARIGPSELSCIGVYTALVALVTLLGVLRFDESSGRRLAVFTMLLWVDVAASWANQLVIGMGVFTILPELVHALVPLHGIAFSLFLFQSDDPVMYHQMKEGTGSDDGLMVEEISPDDDQEDGFESSPASSQQPQ